MRKRSVKSVKDELIKKSREAMISAVQIYNTPQIEFKSETFITLSVIAWTYLLHAFYRGKKINYRYYEYKGGRKKYDKTKHGAYKHWELERCLNTNECPLDNETKYNLRFLIGLRHEIEHQMTNKIDGFLSAKLQACAINFDYYIKLFFGDKYSVAEHLAISIQFAAISPEQEQQLRKNPKVPKNINNFICSFENNLSDDDINNSRYAYRIAYVQKNANRRGQADKVVEFVKPGSEEHGEIERVLLKETEKRKYLPSQVVEKIQQEGYVLFKIKNHTDLWKEKDGKNPEKHYGVTIAKTWYWYDSWITIVREYCQQHNEQFSRRK